MRTSVPSSWLLFALHSYATDLRKWLVRMMSGYAVASGLMLAGVISIVMAVSVGFAAAFHFIEAQYGVYVAYGAIGGFLLVLGLLGLLTGRLLLKRPLPPVPRPRGQTDMLKRSIAAPLAARLNSPSARVDPVTQVLAAAAAVTLVGWIAASRFNRNSGAVRE